MHLLSNLYVCLWFLPVYEMCPSCDVECFGKQVPEVIKAAPAPVILYTRGIYTSFSKDQEAAFHRRGFTPVPGDISNGTGVSEVKLWLEVETAPSTPGSEAADKAPAVSGDAIVSVCVVPPNPSRHVFASVSCTYSACTSHFAGTLSMLAHRAMLDALISKRFMRAAVLIEGSTLWCLTKADAHTDAVPAISCVTQLAISFLATKSVGMQCIFQSFCLCSSNRCLSLQVGQYCMRHHQQTSAGHLQARFH